VLWLDFTSPRRPLASVVAGSSFPQTLPRAWSSPQPRRSFLARPTAAAKAGTSGSGTSAATAVSRQSRTAEGPAARRCWSSGRCVRFRTCDHPRVRVVTACAGCLNVRLVHLTAVCVAFCVHRRQRFNDTLNDRLSTLDSPHWSPAEPAARTAGPCAEGSPPVGSRPGRGCRHHRLPNPMIPDQRPQL
jgi:hypothetical protein